MQQHLVYQHRLDHDSSGHQTMAGTSRSMQGSGVSGLDGTQARDHACLPPMAQPFVHEAQQ